MKRIAVFVAAIGVFAALALAGCAAGPASPSNVTSSALDAIKAQDYETLKNYYSGDVSSINVTDLAGSGTGMDLSALTEEQQAQVQELAKVMTDFDYEIGSETINGDKATVEVTITSHDLSTVFSKAMEKYFTEAFTAAMNGSSEEELAGMFITALSEQVAAQSEKNHTATTVFNLTQAEGEWKLDEFSNDNLDCMMGGMLSGAEDMMNSLGSLLGSDSSLADAA